MNYVYGTLTCLKRKERLLIFERGRTRMYVMWNLNIMIYNPIESLYLQNWFRDDDFSHSK